MKSAGHLEPELVVRKGETLSLSGDALLRLMQAVLDRGVPFRFRAKGWSMTPFIRDGDVISISPLRGALPGTGEVVAFVHPEIQKLIVHRVIGRRRGALLIQGDNTPGLLDDVVPESNVLGRVTAIERNGRRVWLGLGPERYLIAFLSRRRRLVPLWMRLSSLLRPFRRRSL